MSPAGETGVPLAPFAADDQLTSHDLAFRARALAQAHALSEAAHRYRAWRVGRDEPEHPFPELSTWASTAFLTGYCVRCVEESFVEAASGRIQSVKAIAAFPDWETSAADFVNKLPRNAGSTLLAHDLVLAALDDVVSREIDKRAEHVREQVQSAQWSQFEDFIGWWTIHGYAIRAVE